MADDDTSLIPKGDLRRSEDARQTREAARDARRAEQAAARAEAANERAAAQAHGQLTSGRIKLGPISAPVIPILLIGIGGYLAWFGVHYWRGDLKWPSDPIKSVLQGKGLPAASPAAPQSALLTAYEQQENTVTGGQAAAGGGGSTAAPVAAGAAQNTAKLLLSKFGWAASELGPLISLWNRESGWNASARNPSSGAYGIAQALGHGQADTAAPDGTNEYGAEYGLTAAQAQQANAGSTTFQIMWGLGYIQAVYGSPAAAWAHEQQFGWY